MSRPFTARYGGRCGSCGETISAGDTLTWDDDEAVHETCEFAATKAPTRPTCSKCWLEIAASGECGCDE